MNCVNELMRICLFLLLQRGKVNAGLVLGVRRHSSILGAPDYHTALGDTATTMSHRMNNRLLVYCDSQRASRPVLSHQMTARSAIGQRSVARHAHFFICIFGVAFAAIKSQNEQLQKSSTVPHNLLSNNYKEGLQILVNKVPLLFHGFHFLFHGGGRLGNERIHPFDNLLLVVPIFHLELAKCQK